MHCLKSIPHVLSQHIDIKAFSLFFAYLKSPISILNAQEIGNAYGYSVSYLVCIKGFGEPQV